MRRMTTVTMNISLTEGLRGFVDARIQSGGYSSASEYVRELVRRDQERSREGRFEALIQEGLDSVSLPETFDVDAHLSALIDSAEASQAKSHRQAA